MSWRCMLLDALPNLADLAGESVRGFDFVSIAPAMPPLNPLASLAVVFGRNDKLKLIAHVSPFVGGGNPFGSRGVLCKFVSLV